MAKPLVPLNEKAPTPPLLTLVMVAVGNFVLVKVQAILAAGPTAAASKVTDPELRFGVAVPPTPSPVQLIAVTA